MLAGWHPPVPVPRTPVAVAEWCATRRAVVSAAFPGETLVLPSGQPKTRANDIEHPFRPASDFVWLSGWDEPGAVLVLSPKDGGHEVTMYLPARFDRSSAGFYASRNGDLWLGARPSFDEVASMLELDVRGKDQLAAALGPAGRSLRLLRGVDPEVDASVGSLRPEAAASAKDGDDDFARALGRRRLRKDQFEISSLRSAIATTVRGFEDLVRELPADRETSERWIEGTFARRARSEGNDIAYPVIAAGGAHACTLHWRASHAGVSPGELLLVDAGAESRELYAADVTRTLPLSGRFAPIQREVYDVVSAAHDAAIAACRPGNDFLAPHRAATSVIQAWLAERRFIPAPPAGFEERGPYRRFTLHDTSHMLGLDVHDCTIAAGAYRDAMLAPGMVLTVEPGCYFQPDDLTIPDEYRGIGVRIEDDVVITDTGCEVLSAALPTGADEVERWMAALRE